MTAAHSALLGIAFAAARCTPAPREAPGHGAPGTLTSRDASAGSVVHGGTDPDADTAARLVGSWRRDAATACAAQYPAEVRFDASGLYRGTTGSPARLATWDVGTWCVDGAELAITTATDAVVRYRFTLAADVLHVVDPPGCEFGYRRAG